MATLDDLRGDHEALRHAQAALGEALAVSEVSDSVEVRLRQLVRLLQRHLQREDEAWRPYTVRLQMVERTDIPTDHAESHVVLRDLGVLFAAWRIHPTEMLVLHLRRLLDELRERLDEEEREFFPIVEAGRPEVVDHPEGLVKAW